MSTFIDPVCEICGKPFTEANPRAKKTNTEHYEEPGDEDFHHRCLCDAEMFFGR